MTKTFGFESFKNDADVVHFEAEVIEGGMKTRASAQNRETDHAVADMPVIGLVKALRDSFHAEHGFVEIRHSSLILGIERQMSDSCRHHFSLRLERVGRRNPT